MSKSVLVIDTPKSCAVCPLLNGSDECSMQDADANFNADGFAQLAEGCPLKRVPEKKEVCGEYPQPDGIVPSYKVGWNACIDNILKEGGVSEQNKN